MSTTEVRQRMGLFESPRGFSRACLRLALALAIIGIAGLVEPLFALPLAGLLVSFALLARLAESERLDDPDLDVPDLDAPDLDVPDLDAPDLDVPDLEVPDLEVPALVERTFRLPSSVGAERVWLVGEFNDWSHTEHPMRREGAWFTASVDLEAGRSYRYRYLLDGGRWENDWNADEYLPNAFGTDDSVART